MTKPRTCLVTGAAGFIGSHLCRRLLKEGWTVIGMDCFTDYYDPALKERNLAPLLSDPRFTLCREDLASISEDSFAGEEITYVFHQAAQAGVRASWGREFDHYTAHNVLATQRLLEWARGRSLERLVYASSSSVYGKRVNLPMGEEDLPRPHSPYGVTKLAAEHLCLLYEANYAVPAVSLRYFTVYGPNQRPDMAFHRFMGRALAGEEISVYGDGEQTRDFTYVDDIVEANLLAACTPQVAGRVFNIGGGSRVTVNAVLEIIGQLSGQKLRKVNLPVQAGDPPHTYADTSRARRELSYRPAVSLEEGLGRMFASFSRG